MACGELLQLLACGIKQIEVVITVFLAPQDKLIVVPRQEHDGMLRLDIFGMRLAIERCNAITRHGIIAHQFHLVLVTIAFHHIYNVTSGIPRDIGKIAVGGVTCLEIDGIAGCLVINADPHQMRRLTRHRILLGSGCGYHMGAIVEFGDIDERIVGHHALVHAVECQTCALRIPEQAAIDAELVAVYALTINQVTRTVTGHLASVASAISDIEVIIIDKRHSPALVVPGTLLGIGT